MFNLPLTFLYTLVARVLGLLTAYLIINEFSVESYGWWQIIKTLLAYSLIVMEGGFFFYIGILIQKEGYSPCSVRRLIYKYRLYLLLLIAPPLSLYFLFTIVPIYFYLVVLIMALLSVVDYDSLLVNIGNAKYASFVLFVRSMVVLVIVAIALHWSSSLFVIIFSTIAGIMVSSLLINKKYSNYKYYRNGKVINQTLLATLKDSKHYFGSQISQTIMQTADLLVAGILLSASAVAHYGISLLLSELGLMVIYIIQRVIQARYIREHNVLLLKKIVLFSFLYSIIVLIIQSVYGVYLYEYIFTKYDAQLISDLTFILYVYVLFRAINTFIQLHLNSTGYSKVVMYTVLAGALINVVGNIIVVPSYGLLGMPWVTVAAEIFILLSTFTYVKFYRVVYEKNCIKNKE